jgi:pyrimidine-specific ribonucleoside hydrolase
MIILLGLAINPALFSHPWKPAHYVIIDTDGGVDDMRTITMLLASPDVRVLAITVSPGALNGKAACVKSKSLINSFYHEGIPVGLNRSCRFISPDFNVALKTRWGAESSADAENTPESLKVIDDIIKSEKTKISYICLGGLSTVAEALRELPDFKEQVKEIIWSNDDTDKKSDFNYNIDPLSAENILKGSIPVKVIKTSGDNVFYDEKMIRNISNISSKYSNKITQFFSTDVAGTQKYPFTAKDELVAIYIHYPSLFEPGENGSDFKINSDSISVLKEKAIQIISGETVERNQVVKEFPDDPSFYFDDLQPFVKDIIKNHGVDEWVSGIIANELHRHLGVYAIVGVKMGIRAREYFNTGVDEFTVTSHAASEPPLSCMNDGLQVSTGATPGHGLLKVINEPPACPSAEFTYLNRKIRLTLKPDIANKIGSELKEINFIYGLDSNIYWELVRKNSIKYWMNLDRHDIFIIEEIQ